MSNLEDNYRPDKVKNELASEVNTAKEIPTFSKQQLTTFHSKYVDGYDEVLAVLDETNVIPDLEDRASKKDD